MAPFDDTFRSVVALLGVVGAAAFGVLLALAVMALIRRGRRRRDPRLGRAGPSADVHGRIARLLERGDRPRDEPADPPDKAPEPPPPGQPPAT